MSQALPSSPVRAAVPATAAPAVARPAAAKLRRRGLRLLNRSPDRLTGWVLALLPFLAAICVYAVFSAIRHADNPDDKLLPGFAAMAEAVRRLATVPDVRTGNYLFWTDTAASLQRLAFGLAISTAIGFALGVVTGLLPYANRLFASFIAVISMIPALAVLPILFIVAGPGEASKVTLIVIGTAPFLTRDIMARIRELPREQLVKAQTLGAGTWPIALRVVVPQMLPRLLDSARLSLGGAWLFLISAEAIASESGLGYRIFLVRRYFAMDVILPYVAWITLLAVTMDITLRLLQRALFPWFGK